MIGGVRSGPLQLFAGNPQSLGKKRGNDSDILAKQHISGILAGYEMAADAALPETTQVKGLPVGTIRLENLQSCQAPFQRFALITTAREDVCSIHFELVQLGLNPL